MLLINLFLACAVSDAAAETAAEADAFRISPGAFVFDSVKEMKDIGQYVVREEGIEDSKVRVGHTGRHFLVPQTSELADAMSVLSRHPAPPQEVIDVMAGGEKPEKPYDKNFVVFFVDESGFRASFPNQKNATTIYLSTDPALAAASNVPFQGMYGYNATDNLGYVLELSQENSARIVPLSSLQMVGMTTFANTALYRQLHAKIFYIFCRADERENVQKGFASALEEFKLAMKALLIPIPSQGIKIENYGLAEETLPGCVAINDDEGKYVSKNVTPESIRDFVRGVLAGDGELFYNSQTEPEDNETRSVRVITRNNLKTHMEDAAKDRLIVFGTPRCPHCVNVKPILETLGAAAMAEAADKVMVGYCDVEENDIHNVEIQFVPTLILYRAGNSEGVRFEGERNLENLMVFIRDKGALGVDLLKAVSLDVGVETGDVRFEIEDSETAIPEVERIEEATKAEL